MTDTFQPNANQLKVLDWGNGPLLVLAGPGSGKTEVLTHRMARIIKESAGKYFRILGLTFTIKAAAEMQERVNTLIPNMNGRINITTYHSFSAAILRQYGHHLGISPDFTILSRDEDRRVILDEAIAEEGLTHTKYDHNQLLSLVTKLTERNVPMDMAAESLREECQDDAQYIGKIYGCYRRLMIKNNQLDFGGLIAEALKLLTETAAGKLIRRIYPYICVDEFQDASPAQYQLLCSIVNPDTRNLFVVADIDQTIHTWNGASQHGVRQIQEYFDMTVLNLPENYRCPPNVVKMANRLIAHNPSHDKAESIPSKTGERDQPVRVMEFGTVGEEADWVAADIAARPAGSRQGCAVLARTRSALKHVADALEKHGIHGDLSNRRDIFVNDRMIWVHSVIRLANSRYNDIQLRQVCKLFHVLEGVDLTPDKIILKATMCDGDYLRAWWRATLQEELNPTTMSFLKCAMPKLIDRLDVKNFVEDCFAWFEGRQNEDPVPDYDTEYMDERCVWDTLVSESERETGYEQMTMSTLLQQIDLRSKESLPPEGSIPCYTIFASKGMIFDHVYLIRLAEGDLPDWRAVKKGNKSREMYEERRICFVGVTRVQETLTLTYPRSVSGVIKEPSRFLSEMGATAHPQDAPTFVPMAGSKNP